MHFIFNKRNHTYWMTVLYGDLLLHFHIAKLIKYFYNATFTKSIESLSHYNDFNSLLFLFICVNGLHRIIESQSPRSWTLNVIEERFFGDEVQFSSQI